MKRLFAQTILAVCALSVLTGCPSKEGSEPVAEEPLVLPDPVGPGEPVFVAIEKAFYQLDSENEAISLNSFDPQTVPAVSEMVFEADGLISLKLNTVADARGDIEYSILVRNDTVYKINHGTDQVARLHNFPHQVCALYPKYEIARTEALGGQEVIFETLHDNAVFVMTANGDGGEDDCRDLSVQRIYYELSLNYRFDATTGQRCEDENGTNPDPETCLTRQLPVVEASMATAQPVFGWVDDDVTAISGDSQMDVGLLGYDEQDQMLRFYDDQYNLQWEQARSIQQFGLVSIDGIETPAYLFEVTELEGLQYLIQIGRDVFLINGGDLFDLSDAQIESVLSNRVYQLEAKISGADEYVTSLETLLNGNELFIVEGAKLFYKNYETDRVVPTLTRSFDRSDDSLNLMLLEDFSRPDYFSQFDLRQCDSQPDPDACAIANNPRHADWQFFTQCEAALGCSIPEPAGEDCDTEAERLADPTLDNPCSASDYRHLSELNDETDDAQFLAYMPYRDNYMRGLELQLFGERLLVTANLLEKDVLLWFDPSVSFASPKEQREQVIFGDVQSHYGMKAYALDGDIYVSALQYFATRSNECFKNYQGVACQLSNVEDNGGAAACTGKDLAENLCVSTYNEYKSRALFCAASQISDGSCNDANLSVLEVEGSDQDAKWMPVLDKRNDNEIMRMYVLLATDNAGTTGAVDVAEGLIFNATLHPYSAAGGIDVNSLGTIEASIESVWGGVIIDDEEGRMNLYTEEIVQTGGSGSRLQFAELSHYYLDLSSASNPRILPMGASTESQPLLGE